MKAVLPEAEREEAVRKADSLEKMSFEVSTSDSVSMVYKADDEFFIWGPASVEIVDKENDKIRVEALEKALPQLLKRARLSYAHTDQIVGRILDGFETKSPVEVEIDGDVFNRSQFPTNVLELDNADAPALYVAGEVYDDSEQAQSVREKIQDGEIDSYSISGEALVTRKQVENDQVYDDILELDLSAVTLCEEGMNQDAKFARITGQVEDVEFADPESQTAEKASVEPSDRVQSEETVPMSKSENNPEVSDELSDDMKQKLDRRLEEQFDKRFEARFARKAEDLTDALVDSLTEEFEKEIDSRFEKAVEVMAEEFEKEIQNEVASTLPNANLATKGYIDDVVEEVVEEKLGIGEGESKEDYEDGEHEEEMEEEEEAEEEEAEDEHADGYTEEQLKEDLPSDMYEVVSQYLKSDEVEEPSTSSPQSDSGSLDEQVEKILSGGGVETPSVGAEESDDQYEDEIEKEDSGADQTESPALSNFDHR